jgi:HTH-type transcriptional regulator/antitoxin HigA
MQNLDVSKTVNAWSSLADTVFVPHTEAEYDRLVSLLDRLVDEVGEDESHPLASLMEIVGVLIEKGMKTSTFRSCLQNSYAVRQRCLPTIERLRRPCSPPIQQTGN